MSHSFRSAVGAVGPAEWALAQTAKAWEVTPHAQLIQDPDDEANDMQPSKEILIVQRCSISTRASLHQSRSLCDF